MFTVCSNMFQGSDKSGSRLAIGDHSSFMTRKFYFYILLFKCLYSINSVIFLLDYSEDDHIVNSIACGTEQDYTKSESDTDRASSVTIQVESSTVVSKCSRTDDLPRKVNVYNTIQRSAEKCYVYTQPPLNMNLPKTEANTDRDKKVPTTNKVDIATLIITNTSSEASDQAPPSFTTIHTLNKRIDHLERKILRQEMVFRSIDPNIPLSSSDEESKDNIMKTTSGTGRAGCSYIQQYSHVPETSAFQRYAQQAAPLSPSKATTLEKEHNSEQYGRDFTAYDGITARGRRQCASVPCKRDDVPKMAAERVHKIRHKLNPVRDYRLMDTVHYLAQGEFAPRDDGIKLTPSREAVLSDIIWEDVCRTHWPNARLGRRVAHPERFNTRCELQRLIDSLLRERVAHVERRRRRHYRIVKLNHRHESCRPMGKTGDIIVASHKNRQGDEVAISDHTAASAMMTERRREDASSRKTPRSHDRLGPETRQFRHSQDRNYGYDDCPAGPSYAANRSPAAREPTCCYQTSSPTKPTRASGSPKKRRNGSHDLTSASSSGCKTKSPRLVVKKDGGHRKHHNKDEPNLEHYILLPTLVVRTPSNMKRQKKFNELYHRILNVHMDTDKKCTFLF